MFGSENPSIFLVILGASGGAVAVVVCIIVCIVPFRTFLRSLDVSAMRKLIGERALTDAERK